MSFWGFFKLWQRAEGFKPVLSSTVPSLMTKLYFQTPDGILVSPDLLCVSPSTHEIKFQWILVVPRVNSQVWVVVLCFFSAEPCQIEVRLLLAYNSNKSKASAKIPKSTWSESLEALPQSENSIEGTIPFSKPVKVYIMPKPARRWSLWLKEMYLWARWVTWE